MAIRCQWSTVNDAVAPSRVLTPEAPRTEEAALAFTICWPTVLNTWWVTQADTSTFTATINWSDLRWIRLVGKASTPPRAGKKAGDAKHGTSSVLHTEVKTPTGEKNRAGANAQDEYPPIQGKGRPSNSKNAADKAPQLSTKGARSAISTWIPNAKWQTEATTEKREGTEPQDPQGRDQRSKRTKPQWTRNGPWTRS